MSDIVFYSKGVFIWCPHCLKKLLIMNYSSKYTYDLHIKSCSRSKVSRKDEYPEAYTFYKLNENNDKKVQFKKEFQQVKFQRQQSLNKIIQLCNDRSGDNSFKKLDLLPESITNKSLSYAAKKESKFLKDNLCLFPNLNRIIHCSSDKQENNEKEEDEHITIYNKCLKREMNTTEAFQYLKVLQNEIYDLYRSYNKSLLQHSRSSVMNCDSIEERVDKLIIPHACDKFMRNSIKINKKSGLYFSKLYEKMKISLLKNVHNFPTENECYEWFKCKIIKDHILEENVKLSVCFRKKFIYGVELMCSY